MGVQLGALRCPTFCFKTSIKIAEKTEKLHFLSHSARLSPCGQKSYHNRKSSSGSHLLWYSHSCSVSSENLSSNQQGYARISSFLSVPVCSCSFLLLSHKSTIRPPMIQLVSRLRSFLVSGFSELVRSWEMGSPPRGSRPRPISGSRLQSGWRLVRDSILSLSFRQRWYSPISFFSVERRHGFSRKIATVVSKYQQKKSDQHQEKSMKRSRNFHSRLFPIHSKKIRKTKNSTWSWGSSEVSLYFSSKKKYEKSLISKPWISVKISKCKKSFDRVLYFHTFKYMKAISTSLLVLILLPSQGGVWL